MQKRTVRKATALAVVVMAYAGGFPSVSVGDQPV